MKKGILFIGIVLAFASCKKNWKCETTISITSEFYNDVNMTETEFKGTKEDAKNYEVANTSHTETSYMTTDVVTVCK